MRPKNYFKLVKFLDVTFLSILIGIITSVVVNVITSISITFQILIVVLLNFAAIISVIILIRIRQQIDTKYAAQNKAGLDDENWKAAVDINKKGRYITYVLGFWIGVICFLFALSLLIYRNNNENQASNNYSLKNDQIGILYNRIDKLTGDSIKLRDSIKMLNHSLGKKFIPDTAFKKVADNN